MSAQPLLDLPGWVPVLDGHPAGVRLYEGHYSSERSRERRQERGTRQFGGCGERMVLLTADESALFVWRRQDHRLDAQSGVECAIFRNEGRAAASALILAAEGFAWGRWPGERLFTFVDPSQVRGTPSGNCFLRAGWRLCEDVTARGLLIFEKRP